MRILFFGPIKDLTGCSEITWSEVGSLTTDRLWQRLEQEWPAIRTHRSVTRLARNHEFVGLETTFEPGDEIALIPPVSGG